MALSELQLGMAQQLASNQTTLEKAAGEGRASAALADSARMKPCKDCGQPRKIGGKCKPCHAAAERAKYAAAHPNEPPQPPPAIETEPEAVIVGYMIRKSTTVSLDSGPMQMNAGREFRLPEDACLIGDLQRIGDIELIPLYE